MLQGDTRYDAPPLAIDAAPAVRSPLPAALTSPRVRVIAIVAVLAIVLAHAAFVLLPAPRAELTSDESLYISEALNIAKGIGPKYTTGDWVQHRPFLFPALLAAPLKLTGGDFTSVYWVTKAIVLLNLAALGVLAYRTFGAGAAAFAVLLALPNKYLNLMGVTAYLDGLQTLFLLIALTCTWEGHRRERVGWWAAAGASLGLAFLVKEAAFLWLPLPAVFVLLTHRADRLARSLIALACFYAAFVAATGWWWAYVWIVDDRMYLWPYSPPALAGTIGMLGVVAALWAVVLLRVAPESPRTAETAMRAVGATAGAAWVVGFTYVMETTSWPYHTDFLSTLPSYAANVMAGNLHPWPLVAAATAAIVYRSWRDPAARLIALGLAFWLPFAIFAGHRNFAFRDLLPMVYLAYAAAGWLFIEVLRWLLRDTGRIAGALGVALLCGAVAFVGFDDARTFRADAASRDVYADWDNPLVRRTAAWIEENVEPGAPIMSSRIYFSHLYTLTEARYPIAQLPTVNVVPQPRRQPYLRSRATLFRWEDSRLAPPRVDERWIMVDEFASKSYYTALSEHDLLDQIRDRGSRYLVVSGEDVAFSSVRYVDYFIEHPAFELLHRDVVTGVSAMYVFAIDHDALAPRDFPAVVPASTLNSLYARHRGDMDAETFLAAISPRGVIARPSAGLHPELAAVLGEGDDAR